MKTKYFAKISIAILAMIITSSVFAYRSYNRGYNRGYRNISQRGWKPWVWRKYNLRFKLPRHWRVTRKDARGFGASSGTGASMFIKPFRNSRMTAKQVAYRAYVTFTNTKRKRIVMQRQMHLSGSRKRAYIIVGKGYQRGRAVMFGLVGIINPRNSDNVLARFAWWDDGSAKSRMNSKTTYNIAKSFR